MNLVDAVGNCVVGVEDGFGEGGFTDGDGGDRYNWGNSGNWSVDGSESGEAKAGQTETEDLTLLAISRRLSESKGLSVSDSVLSLGGGYFGGVLNGLKSADSDDSGFGIGVSGFMGQTSSDDLGGILDGSGGDQISNGSLGEIVGKDTETVGISDVAHADLFAFGVDVSVASDLVTESILVVGSSLSGVGITVGGLTELILRAVLASGVSVSVVGGSSNDRGGNGGSDGSSNDGSGNGGGVSGVGGGGVSGVGGGGVSGGGGCGESGETVTVVVRSSVESNGVVESVTVIGELSLGSNCQQQQGCNLWEWVSISEATAGNRDQESVLRQD